MKLTIEIAELPDEDGDYIATVVEHPGLSAFGPTQEVALKEITTVLSLVSDTPACVAKLKLAQANSDD